MVVQAKNTHYPTTSEHSPWLTPLELSMLMPREPSTDRAPPPRPATSHTVIYGLGPALATLPYVAPIASPSSGSPQTPPEAGPVAATRRSEAILRRRAGCPAPSAADSIMTPKHDVHGHNELFCPGLLPSRSPPR